MTYDPNKVVMGTTRSNEREVTNYPSDPATFTAGKAVRLKSDGTLSVTKADGSLVGISLGKDLSDTKRVAVCRKGLGVPILLTAAFDPAVGAVVYIDDVTGLANASGSGKTACNAVYAEGRAGGTGVNGGIAEDGTAVGVAYIDFPGGL